ncbi:MAG: alpha/beta fold hydrolase [Acidimicrobiia bacterium]|nr:alpha/beta fold hydrolase [Acidimicrobiia bacterium]
MPTSVRHVIYLHGFASSPASGKAEQFRDACEAQGTGFTCPDLNQPAFETLTTSRMLAQVREIVAGVPGGPVALVGSSLGAFVAVLAAHEDTTGRIDRLVLLAPALDFGGNRLTHLWEHSVEDWKRAGSLTVFHYADERDRQIGYALYEDAGRYDALTLPVTRPTLVFQGTKDDVVTPGMVQAWAHGQPLVDLRMLADGHQLSTSIHTILTESLEFLTGRRGATE